MIYHYDPLNPIYDYDDRIIRPINMTANGSHSVHAIQGETGHWLHLRPGHI